MRPLRTCLFILLAIGSGISLYLATAGYIEATGHSASFKPQFYFYALGFPILFAAGISIAWHAWRFWASLVALGLAAAAFVVMLMLFFLPFP